MIEDQMPFIERIARAGKLDGPNSILLKNFFRALLLHKTSAKGFKYSGSQPKRHHHPVFRRYSDVVSLRRGSPPCLRFHSTPLPVDDLGHVFAVLGDVCFVLKELVANRLFGIGGTGPELRQPINHVAEEM